MANETFKAEYDKAMADAGDNLAKSYLVASLNIHIYSSTSNLNRSQLTICFHH